MPFGKNDEPSENVFDRYVIANPTALCVRHNGLFPAEIPFMDPDFRNRLIFRISQGLGEGHAAGFPSATRLLDQAFAADMFAVDHTLDDLAVVLLEFNSPVSSPLHQAARHQHLAGS